MMDSKRCPYCAEEVRREAIKCKHCGSGLQARRAISDWYRTGNDKMIAGVCGGIARQFSVPTAIVRLGFVLMTVLQFGLGILVYGVLWIVMPMDEWESDLEQFAEDTTQEP